ncbi:MAG: hypothetical protein CMQ05_03395 [Gammaproteobacteria bacterium]|uniref:Uncharacterized protein n=1 Tax=OM182 bacterium MED-G24 TaxID=1986255 RepID=A0A2A5WK86_9GAMM|nr:hypothetical protein [Gammaproteobacteria bacterium]PDH36842.1 MAG: hypothetical protein CNE99_08995 [OM182 bacterium MED-G24]|tara:strand:- start:1632 stop:1874 length:243 start_codon:yes stop_codon:yes gene_type:complete
MATDPLISNPLLFLVILGVIIVFVIGWIGFWIYFVLRAHQREMGQDYALTHDEYRQQLENFHKRNGTWVGDETPCDSPKT